MSRWTVERKADLVRLWNSNATLREMGDHFGVSGSAVCNQAKAMGLPPRVEQKPAWDSAEDRALIRMVAEGRGNTEIAAHVGRTVAAVQRRKTVLRKARSIPPAVVAPAPEYLAKPRIVTERKLRKCLHCRELFESQHKGNWICPGCAPIVNRAQGAIA